MIRFWINAIIMTASVKSHDSKVRKLWPPRADDVELNFIKNLYLPVQKCPPNPGLHRLHLPVVLSHTFSFRLLPHLHSDSQRSPKNPGLHSRPPIFNIKKLYMYVRLGK